MQKADTLKKAANADWHRADIVSAIWKRGSSLIRLSRKNGYADGSLCLALQTPWPKAEKIIAAFIGVPPQQIWPTRYHEDGSPLSRRGERGLGRYKRKASRPASNNNTAGHARNVEKQRAA